MAQSNYRIDLKPYETVANADVTSNLPATDSRNQATDLSLRIVRSSPEKGTFEFMLFGPLLKPGAFFIGHSQKSNSEVFAAVEECRAEWKQTVVDFTRSRSGESGYEWPFQDRWKFDNEPEFLANIAPKLAVAGNKLFVSLFELDCDLELPELAATLRGALAVPRCIAVTSDDFFVPWPMLYTHPPEREELAPDGSNWDKRGFWGYQHIIQQSPNHINLDGRIDPSANGEIPFSITFDDRLPVSLGLPSIHEHIKSISTLTGKGSVVRTLKKELRDALTGDKRKLERILYFYCHGHGSSSGGSPSTAIPRLSLRDGDITASDFQLWAKGYPPTGALIIINACQGGQMTTLFYGHFAKQLLKEGAVGLVGAQIDVPAVFASAYGELLLKWFLARDGGGVRLGPLIQTVNRIMWDAHKNPLALVYSLYRGVDCFIDWPKP